MKLMNRHAIFYSVLAAFLMTGCVGCDFSCHGSPKVWVESEEDLAFPVEGINNFNVESHNGMIRITASEQADRIAVHAEIKAGGPDQVEAKRCLDAIELVASKEDDTQSLSWTWKTEKKRSWQQVVSFEIVLPARLSVSAETHNGEVDLSGLAAAADLCTHNGNMTIKDHVGPIKVESHNGSLEVGAVTSEFALTTHNGNIEARLDGSGALNGSIITHNGSVHVGLGEQASTRLDCRTHHGRITVDRVMSDMTRDKKSLKGTIGSGDGKVEVTTYNGSIKVK